MFGTERAPGTDPEPLRGQGPAAQIAAGDKYRERERLQHPMTSPQPLPTRKNRTFFVWEFKPQFSTSSYSVQERVEQRIRLRPSGM
jgi:hypothetical protein